MKCGITCIVAFVFLVANIYIIFSTANDKKSKQQFHDVLNNKQKDIYQNIINERKQIYYMGYVLGIILALLAYYYNKKILGLRLNNMSLVCLVGSIVFATNYFFYILYPKSDHMLLHLNDKKQIEEWVAIYRKMQINLHIGFVLGILAVMVFCYSFRE
jgi:hypothetical protein